MEKKNNIKYLSVALVLILNYTKSINNNDINNINCLFSKIYSR